MLCNGIRRTITMKIKMLLPPREKKKNRFVRHNSIESIQKMIESLHLHTVTETETETVPDGIEIDLQNLDLAHDEMVHAWTKLELIAVRERYWGRHLGSLLLACALYNAHYKFDQSNYSYSTVETRNILFCLYTETEHSKFAGSKYLNSIPAGLLVSSS